VAYVTQAKNYQYTTNEQIRHVLARQIFFFALSAAPKKKKKMSTLIHYYLVA